VKCVLISHSVVVHNLPTVPGREGGCAECGSTGTTTYVRKVFSTPQHQALNGISAIYHQLHLRMEKKRERERQKGKLKK